MNDRKASIYQRICFVCGTHIPENQGAAHMHLGIRTHQGACKAAVAVEERVYDRSPRGRWRPKRAVLARVRAKREAAQ
jgi:hypothetical protein